MANTVTINSADELRTYKATILSNLAKSVWDISAIIEAIMLKRFSDNSSLKRLPPSLYLESRKT